MRRRVRTALENDGGSKAERHVEKMAETVPEKEEESCWIGREYGSAVRGGGSMESGCCAARDSHPRIRRAASSCARSWVARSAAVGAKNRGAGARTAATFSGRTLSSVVDRRKSVKTATAARGTQKAVQGRSLISNLRGWIPILLRGPERLRKVLWPIIFGPGRSSRDLLEEAKRRATLVIFLIVFLAFLMSLTSNSVLVNIPVAALALAALRRLYIEVDFNWKWRPSLLNREQPAQVFLSTSPSSHLETSASSSPFMRPVLGHCPSMPPRSETVGVDSMWRQAINAPTVETAIDDLMRAVVDEFVTNLWYRALTPDQDATEELRLLLNGAIAEIARRAKKVNLVSLLARDAVELLGKQLDLFRRTKERIGEQLLETLPSGERDEQIRQAMDATGELHVSLKSADAEYKVLRRLMGGVVAIVLRPEEAHCGVVRCLARELLACALMRPVMRFASPGYINEVILLLVPSLEERRQRYRHAAAATTMQSRADENKPRGEASRQTVSVSIQPSIPQPTLMPILTPKAATVAISMPSSAPTSMLAPASLDRQSESISSSGSVGASSGKGSRDSSTGKSRPGNGSAALDVDKGLLESDRLKRTACHWDNSVLEGDEGLPEKKKTAMLKESISPRKQLQTEKALDDHEGKVCPGSGDKCDQEKTKFTEVNGENRALVAEHWDGLWTGVNGEDRGRRSAPVTKLEKGEKENKVRTATTKFESGPERNSEVEGRKRPKKGIGDQRGKEVVITTAQPGSDKSTNLRGKEVVISLVRPGTDESAGAVEKTVLDESTELLSLWRVNDRVTIGEEDDGERFFGNLRQQEREDKFRGLFDDEEYRGERIKGIGFLGVDDRGPGRNLGRNNRSASTTGLNRIEGEEWLASSPGGGSFREGRQDLPQEIKDSADSQQCRSAIQKVKDLAPAFQRRRCVSYAPSVEIQLSEEDDSDHADINEADYMSRVVRHNKGSFDWPAHKIPAKEHEIEEAHHKENGGWQQPVVGKNLTDCHRSSSVNISHAERSSVLRPAAVDVVWSSSIFANTTKLQAKVVDTWLQEAGLKSFVVYSIFVIHVDGSDWIVNRRYRNFEQLHRRLKEMPQYKLRLPPKRFFTDNLDGDFVCERRIQLDKYLQDLLAIPTIAESHDVYDFLSAESKTYGCTGSSSMIKALAVHVDDAVDSVFRRLGEVSDEVQGALSKATVEIRRRFRETGVTGEQYGGRVGKGSRPWYDEKDRPADSARHSTTGNLLGKQANIQRSRSLGVDGALRVNNDGSEGNVDPLTGLEIPESAELVSEDDDNRTEGKETGMDAEGVGESEARPSKETGELESGFQLDEAEEAMFSSEDEDSIPPEWKVSKLSVPLLNLVDEIFELHQHWIRRQVFWIARHILELGMGDAIDDFILGKIQLLRREDTIAAVIKWIHKVLWPDGVFFLDHPDNRPSPLAASVPNPAYVPLSGRTSPRHPERGGVKVQKGVAAGKDGSNKHGKVDTPPQPTFQEKLEAASKAIRVKDLFVGKPPRSLSSLIGSKQYKKCALDAYYFLQSPVCIRQYAYGLLELLLLAVFPELNALIRDVRSGIA